MKVGIIGAGGVGMILGKRWQNAGHEIVYGVRDPEKYQASGSITVYKTIHEVLSEFSVILLAVPGAVARDIVEMQNLTEKIIIDAI